MKSCQVSKETGSWERGGHGSWDDGYMLAKFSQKTPPYTLLQRLSLLCLLLEHLLLLCALFQWVLPAPSEGLLCILTPIQALSPSPGHLQALPADNLRRHMEL